MHYLICYDVENDQKRLKIAKILQKNGCDRVQKSVFIASDLPKRDLNALMIELRNEIRTEDSRGDSIIVIPIRSEHVPEIQAIGDNNIISFFDEPLAKVIT